MMRILMDTSVILDVFLQREPHYADAARLWDANLNGRLEAWVSAITPINIVYIGRKFKDTKLLREAISGLLATHKVCTLNWEILNAALVLPVKDFEDAVQIAGALSHQLDAIVTRDKKDFSESPLPVYTPIELLALLENPT